VADDIVHRLTAATPYGLDDHAVLADASAEIRALRQQVALWKSAAEAYEMGFFDKGDSLVDKARNGSDFIKETTEWAI